DGASLNFDLFRIDLLHCYRRLRRYVREFQRPQEVRHDILAPLAVNAEIWPHLGEGGLQLSHNGLAARRNRRAGLHQRPMLMQEGCYLGRKVVSMLPKPAHLRNSLLERERIGEVVGVSKV